MRNRFRLVVLSLVCGLLFAIGPQASAGVLPMTVCVVDEAAAPVVGAAISSPDIAGLPVTDATGCAAINSLATSVTVTVTPPAGSTLLSGVSTFEYVAGTTHTITLLAAPPSPTAVPTEVPVIPTEVPVIPTEVPVLPTEVPVTPEPGTGSLQIVKADCDIDAPLVTTGDSTLDAAGCEPGHATFALYLYGDGTDAVVATAETHNGWTELLLAPGDYVVVEDGTWAQITVTVTDGAVTWAVFHNPTTAPAPAPTTAPAPKPGTTPPPAAKPAPAKVTTLPKTGTGEGQNSSLLLIGAAGVLLMASGAVLTSKRRTM